MDDVPRASRISYYWPPPQARGLARQGLRLAGAAPEALRLREDVRGVVPRQVLRLTGATSAALGLREGVHGVVGPRAARLFPGPSKYSSVFGCKSIAA